MNKLRLGLALTGSYCTFDEVLVAAERLCVQYEVMPIFSENAASTDTRFGRAADFKKRLEDMAGRPALCTIRETEPIGPKGLLDILVIAPCTGNTLAKLAHGVTDTSVTMAAKAHLRNGRPLVVAVSSNDALSTGAMNLGILMVRKNVYLVPFRQDDAEKKPTSLVADFWQIGAAVEAALAGQQLQPLLL